MPTIPTTGPGGSPPPTMTEDVGVMQKSGISYDFAKPRFSVQEVADAVLIGRFVPKKALPPMEAAAFTTFSPWSRVT